MTEVKIVLQGAFTFFNCTTHIGTIITDLRPGGKCYLIDFPFPSYDSDDPRARNPQKKINAYARAKNTFQTRSVTLYSVQNCDNFIEKFKSTAEFKLDSEFKWFTNNCSSAVNFVLDYFFAEGKKFNESYKILQLFFSALCLGGNFLCQCLPSPPCMDTPADVFRKAEWLASMEKYNLPQDLLNGVEIQNEKYSEEDHSDLFSFLRR